MANKRIILSVLSVAPEERWAKGRRIVSCICSSEWMGAGRCKGTRRKSETGREGN